MEFRPDAVFLFFSSSFFALCVYRSHPSPPVKLKYGLAFKKAPDTNPTCVCQTNSPPMDLVNSLLTRLDSSIPLLHFTLMTTLLNPQGRCAISLLRNVFLILLVDFHQKIILAFSLTVDFPSFFLSVFSPSLFSLWTWSSNSESSLLLVLG